MDTYRVNEIFYSIQGEGVRAGTAAVFLRLSKCNLTCKVETHGFDCDTEFESGVRMTLDEIGAAIADVTPNILRPEGPPPERWIIVTGGEPALQVDQAFCSFFRDNLGFKLAVETNGSIELPTPVGPPPASSSRMTPREYIQEALRYYPFDWITVSPKVAEHALRQTWAHEVKYVRGAGQSLPQTRVRALHQLVSPAFRGEEVDPAALATCTELVKNNPDWRLSVQQHKAWRVR